MLTVADVLIEAPSKGGTEIPLKAPAMQLPTGVPANGGPRTVADVTLPLGAKVMLTFALPVGPSGCLQPRAAPFALATAACAAARSNSLPPAPAAAVSAGLAVSTGLGGSGVFSGSGSAVLPGPVGLAPTGPLGPAGLP